MTISILGCGWLGLPLAQFLMKHGWSVQGSTTDSAKLPLLKYFGICPYVLTCSPELTGENFLNFFESRILFLNIPFRRQMPDPEFYRAQIDSVVKYAVQGGVDWIIFASSTSVYPEATILAREEDALFPDTQRAQVLYNVEQMLLKNSHFDSTIIRFAGLFGPGRPIGKFMSGKVNLANGQAPVNLIHLDDCLGIILAILAHNARRNIFNACTDEHPARQELYTAAAKGLGILLPEFSKNQTSVSGKIVCNQKVKDVLNYRFVHPDPLVAALSGMDR